jgi:hypothetical protein
VKYDFIKGKNNFQCGIDISKNTDKNQIDLNLLLLNVPIAEYGIGVSDGKNQKNLFVIDNKKSNRFSFVFDADKLKEFDKLIIYNIDNYYDNLFVYDLKFLGLCDKSNDVLVTETAAEKIENKTELEDIEKISEKFENIADISDDALNINGEQDKQTEKDDFGINQFKEMLPQWIKTDDANDNSDEENKQRNGKNIMDFSNLNEKNNKEDKFDKPLINQANKELIKMQNAEIDQLNKKNIQQIRKEDEINGVKISKQILNEYFRRIEPFEPKIRNHVWYTAIDNTKKFLVELNGHLVDYQTLYFNSADSYSHEGYPKRIIGYYNKESGSRDIDYIVLGALGEYKQTHQPMRGITGYVYWHNAGNNLEFGYWVVYLEYGTGKIIVPLNRKK